MRLPPALSHRLSRNVFLLAADSGLTNIVSFAIIFTIARCYSVEVVGQVSLLVVVMAMATLLGDFGSGQASTLLISRRLADMGGPKPGQAVGTGLLHAAVGGAVLGSLVLLIPTVVPRIADALGAPDRAAEVLRLGPLIRLVALWVLAATLMQQTIGVFAGFQRMQYSLLQNTVTHLPRLGICAAVALLAEPWEHIVHGWTLWYGVAAVFALGLLVIILRRCDAGISLMGYRPLRRLRLGAALFTPLAAAFILQYLAMGIIWWMDPHGQGYRSVGYYVPIWSLTRGYEVVLWPVAVALLPAVSDAHGTRDAAVLAGLVRRALGGTGLAAAAILGLFMAVPEHLLGLFGNEYQHLVLPLMILALAMAFEAQRCALDPLLNGSGLARWVTGIEWCKFGLLYVLAVPLYQAHYLTGIAVAFVGALVPAWLAKLLLIRFKLHSPVAGRAVMVAALIVVIFAVGMVVRSLP
jgi:O-antigen/teichoic acid export membrane protein